ncbi:MAG: DUF1559 domain-containing protein [Pirellulales bacterium]
MRDLLVCYLLGELSEAERAALEAKLAGDPRLRDELERLRQCLTPEQVAAPGDVQPPRNLIDRTVQCVSDSQSGGGVLGVTEPPAGRSYFSFVDAFVAVGVVFAISMLLLPALRESRDISRRTTCQNNMRQLGTGMIAYAIDHRDIFPPVNPDEPAGIYTVRLAESGHLDRAQILQLVICPSSPQVEMLERGSFVFRIPTLSQVTSSGTKLPPQVTQTMGGSLAYRVGYAKDQFYISIRNRSDCRSPLLSDAPSRENIGQSSPHHGGCGQNVLFEDGRVAYVVGYLVPAWDNHMFLNNYGQAAFGTAWDDPVLGRSEMVPGVRAVPVDRLGE